MNGSNRSGFWEQLFTRQERKALAFILAVGFFGLGVRVCQKVWPVSNPNQRSPAALHISVNRANEAELTALPGIGPVTARRILQMRQQDGRFITSRDLLKVKGISPKTLEKLQGILTFD